MTPARHIRTPFKDPLVRAIAADEKTVTRRLIPNPGGWLLDCPVWGDFGWRLDCFQTAPPHFGTGIDIMSRCKPGDTMDVCEALVPTLYDSGPERLITYRADGVHVGTPEWWPWKVKVQPARYCPTRFVRHHRRLISVRPERLSEVTDAEAHLEGIRYLGWPETREGFLTGFRALHKLAADADSWVERREWAPGEVTGE